ncbi:hypothetical protein VHEMI08943 [[Torrubiella] hemipterigena]|uniref:Uncharacterized protein n=1 Tax=[Torrubiella] hemipterigena TaxID=1531966 RepID=A0A0A1TP47_9HYPO|nr:hypothetical protein VHEMI08943 [[Torrubiella] hemipterigena]
MDRVRQRSTTLARSDDETSVLRKRITTFLQTKDAILDHLVRNKLSTIDGNGTADEVFVTAEKIVTTT